MKNRIYTTTVCAVLLAAFMLTFPGTGTSAMVDDVENVIQSVTGRATATYGGVPSGVKDALRLYEDGTFKYKDGTNIDDAAITAAIKTRIIGQKELDALDISVKTVKGTVTLKGNVEHIAQVLLAEQVANDTDGVLKVQNELTLVRFPAASASPRVL